jgi:hypothetical protein
MNDRFLHVLWAVYGFVLSVTSSSIIIPGNLAFTVNTIHKFVNLNKNIQSLNGDNQWGYSPDRALASLMGFMIVCSTMWG